MSMIVGVREGEIVSSCVLVVVPNLTRTCRPFALIENVITHPAFRRRGFGTSVLMEAVRIARAEDCYKVVLSTASTREGTWLFYERAGFKRGTRTTFEIRNM
jgi:ribosomal protein S18 acetylase RimI-like enzyme